MSTIKISELATGAVTLESLLAFADSNGIAFKGSVDELNDLISNLAVSGMKGAISTTDASPLEDGLYPCSESGTYTNFGGLIIDISSTLSFISVSATQTVFSKVDVPISFLIDTIPTDGSPNAIDSNAVFVSNASAEVLITKARKAGDKADAYKRFQNYGDLTNLYTDFNGANKVEFYKAFEILELTGFDKTRPHRFNVFWVNAYAQQYFRLIIEEFDGTNWVESIDTSSGPGSHFTATSLGVVAGKLTVFEFEKNDKKLYAEIDYDNLPTWGGPVGGGDLDSGLDATLIINQTCFIEEVTVIDPIVESDLQKVTGLNIAEMNTLTSKDDVKDGVFNGWLNNSYEPENVIDSASGEWRTYKLNCVNHQNNNLTFGTTDSSYRKWVFYNNSTQLNSGDYALNSPETLNVPSTATHLYVMLRRFQASESFANWRLNKGDVLTSYREYVERIESIRNLTINGFTSLLESNATKNFFNSRRKPTISFVFDGTQPTDQLAFDLFQEYGFIANYAVKPSLLTTSNQIVYDNAYKNGSSIIAYPYGGGNMNDTSRTNADVDEVMATSKKMLRDKGFKVSGWQTPGSSLNVKYLPEIIKNYGYGFTALNAGLYNETLDPVKMHRYALESEFNSGGITAVKARMDTAITNNELLVCYGHHIPSLYIKPDGVTPYMTESELRELLTYLRTKVDNNECFVLATDEAIQSYYKPVITY